MLRRVKFREMDWVLVTLVLLISLVGVLEVYSTTQNNPRFAGLYTRHLAWLAIGFLAMLVMARLDYHTLLDNAPWIYLIMIAGLIVVLLFGTRIFGARRWLEFGGLTFQVSEAAKWAIIIVLAKFFGEHRRRVLGPWDLVKVALLVGGPILLIAAEPDLGTSLTLIPIAATGILLAGIRWKHVVVLALAAALLMPLGWYVLKPYQRQRIISFVNPAQSTQGSGYQTLQSKIAVGSGGFWGKGMGQGSQNQLGFIPVRHAEFILAAYAEEQGFAGVLLVLGLYLALILRLLHNLEIAPDKTGSFLIAGVFGLITFHLLVNVGMVLGILPVTGIPLLLMSYGGSSTVATFMMLGLVMSVRMRRFVNL